MKITHWNFFTNNNIISGAGRYEEELFKNMQNTPNMPIKRINGRNIFAKHDNSDINHATYQELAPLKILRQLKNFVLTVHDIIPTTQYNPIQKIRHLWYLSEMCIGFADKIITDSEFTKKELINRLGIFPDKIHVIPLGVSEDYTVYDKQLCRGLFNLKPDKKYILMVSSNKPWKNLKLANEIIDKLYPEYNFIKIGYGEGNLGYVPEMQMPYLYNACDLFLHTSLYEGFGLPILEAMACGCPVISSNAASLPEVVKNAGFLIPPVETQLFIDIIRCLLNNDSLYNTMREKGIKNAEEFTWERTAKETLDVYKSLSESLK